MRELHAKILQFTRYIRCFKLKSASNLILLRASYYGSIVLKRPFLIRPPAFISIEPVNFCNLACPECPTGNGTMIRPQQQIDIELASVFIRMVSKHVLHINFYFQGEPFLHQGLHLLIAEAYKNRIVTEVSTNGHFITSQVAEDIVRSGLTKLIVSLDGNSQESYSQYRRNGEFEKVLSAIQAFKEAKRKCNSVYPIICVQVLVLSSTEKNLQEIKTLAYQVGADSVTFKTAQFYSLDIRDALLPQNAQTRYRNTPSGYVHTGKARNRCWRAWSNPVVCSDGAIVPCCYDKNAEYQFGNSKISPNQEIWNTDERIKFLTNIMTGRNNIEMCRNCPEGRGFFM